MAAFLAVLAVGFAVAGAVLWGWPRWAVGAGKAFPRCRVAGWVLCAADVAWICWNLHGMALGPVEFLEPWLIPIGIVVFAAVAWGLPELLAVRALGGLLLLAANPALSGLYFAEDPPGRVWAWHDVAAGLVYAGILVGGWWLLRPWAWRVAGEWLARHKTARWVMGGVALAGAAALSFGAGDVVMWAGK